MFNVGGMELIVIGLLALIVLGPDKLPGALRQLGSVMGELRRISQGFQTDLKSAIADAEREADAEKKAAGKASDAAAPAIGPAGTAPDPGSAMAAAQAELEAIEGASAPAADRPQDAPAPSTGPAGAEGPTGTTTDVAGSRTDDA